MASIPLWVVQQHSAVAIAVYAALDLQEGSGTHSGLADLLNISPPTAKRGLDELVQRGTIRRKKLATYELRRDDFSTSSTELCTGRSTGEAAAGAASDQPSLEISTVSTGPTTTARDHGDKPPGVNTGGAISRNDDVPKTMLIAVDGFERKQNLGFNALAKECDADPRARFAEISAALKKIRAFAWDEMEYGRLAFSPDGSELFEKLLVTRIVQQASLYRRRMKGATLTPSALAKWWFDLEKLPEQGLSPDEIASGSWRNT